MADFVAVIRRTVDGLSDNVPEMREKVYDKARGAVRRQLENMKPRPSDEMIERQMVKLEAAITEVEGDHAVALPADEPAIVPEAEQVSAPAPEAIADDAPTEVDDPASHTDDVASAEVVEPPSEPVEPEEAAPVAVDDAPVEPEPFVADAQEEQAVEEPIDQAVPDDVHHPAEEDRLSEVETAGPDEAEPVYSEPVAETPEPSSVDAPADEPPVYPQPDAWPEQQAAEPAADDSPDPEPDDRPVVDAEPETAADPEPETPAPSIPPASTEWELPEWNDPAPAPVTAHSEPVREEPAGTGSIVDEIENLVGYTPAATRATTSVDDDDNAATDTDADADRDPQPAPSDPSHTWGWGDNDPFAQQAPPSSPAAVEGTEPAISDWSWPVEKPPEAPVEQTAQKEPWDDIDNLLHGGGEAAAVAASQSARQLPVSDELAPRPVSYRAEPKRSHLNGKAIGLSAVLLLLLGGGGYAYWQNQDAVNNWVSETVASVTSSGPPAATTTPATNEGTTTQPVTPTTEGAAQSAAGTDVAAMNANTKFTQRLQADGTELDPGPAPALNGEVSAEEGKSVAAQTEASKPQDAAQAQPAPTTGTNASPPTGTPAVAPPTTTPVESVPAGQTADPAPAQIPAGAQKMFLYEERLGQTAPTAIEGSVAWSIKQEAPEEGQRPEPVIQAQINVPDRGLTALMTIKRNADTSLPASHVIEFVFSLPENFEGGSIDNVQRVAMKRNEQDRGDALIAVPAKITEDFHMIALNDFPEAVATNTELLRTRPWIDIPLTYRNGRRALLTLEKGTAGTEAFTTALQAWSNAPAATPAVQ